MTVPVRNLLYLSDHVEVARDTTTHVLHVRWMGHQPSERIQSAGSIILNLMREHQATRIANDNRLVMGSWWDAAGWTAEVWFPDMFRAGLQQFGWVLSPNIFAELSARRAMVPFPDYVRPFDSEDSVVTWLMRDTPRLPTLITSRSVTPS